MEKEIIDILIQIEKGLFWIFASIMILNVLVFNLVINKSKKQPDKEV
jgi:hypothetical protein